MLGRKVGKLLAACLWSLTNLEFKALCWFYNKINKFIFVEQVGLADNSYALQQLQTLACNEAISFVPGREPDTKIICRFNLEKLCSLIIRMNKIDDFESCLSKCTDLPVSEINAIITELKACATIHGGQVSMSRITQISLNDMVGKISPEALIKAIREEDVATVAAYIAQGGNIALPIKIDDEANVYYFVRGGNKYALYEAVALGNCRIVRMLIQAGANVNGFELPETALALAMRKGNAEMCELLLSFGADPYIKSRERYPRANAVVGLFCYDHNHKLAERLSAHPAVNGIFYRPEDVAEIVEYETENGNWKNGYWKRNEFQSQSIAQLPLTFENLKTLATVPDCASAVLCRLSEDKLSELFSSAEQVIRLLWGSNLSGYAAFLEKAHISRLFVSKEQVFSLARSCRDGAYRLIIHLSADRLSTLFQSLHDIERLDRFDLGASLLTRLDPVHFLSLFPNLDFILGYPRLSHQSINSACSKYISVISPEQLATQFGQIDKLVHYAACEGVVGVRIVEKLPIDCLITCIGQASDILAIAKHNRGMAKCIIKRLPQDHLSGLYTQPRYLIELSAKSDSWFDPLHSLIDKLSPIQLADLFVDSKDIEAIANNNSTADYEIEKRIPRESQASTASP